jgi:hypothetical protein
LHAETQLPLQRGSTRLGFVIILPKLVAIAPAGKAWLMGDDLPNLERCDAFPVRSSDARGTLVELHAVSDRLVPRPRERHAKFD